MKRRGCLPHRGRRCRGIFRYVESGTANAIQAVAAVCSAITTSTLLFFTWRYVRLTGELANTARAQTDTAKEPLLHERVNAQLEAVRQYFQQGDTREHIAARGRVAQAPTLELDKTDAAEVAALFHFWGLMVQKEFLPLWVFDGSSGRRVVQYYEKHSGFIEHHRRNGNPDYAEHFEWLYRQLSNSTRSPK